MAALAYYNEIDPDAALILRELIADGVIAPGEIDTRSITEVQPDDLRGFTQCHFFAGGGLWSVAARMSGWGDDRPIWTASCPCQPFSVAGKGAGTDDVRHLWPDLLRLAGACRPAVIVGEQVAGKAGYGWLDGVRADLAGEGYASRGVDIPACAVDAPHIRQRLYWVALRNDCPACGGWGRIGPFFPGAISARCGNCTMANAEGIERGAGFREGGEIGNRPVAANSDGGADLLANTESINGGRNLAIGQTEGRAADGRPDEGSASGVTLGDAFGSRWEGQSIAQRDEDAATRRADAQRADCRDSGHGDVGHADGGGAGAQSRNNGEVRGVPEAQCEPEFGAALSGRTDGRNGSFWSDYDWLICHDGKARRTQPGIPLLVDGLPGRVALWRVAGNAISPVLAAEVIGALMDMLDAERPAA